MRGIKIRPLHHGNMHADLELLITGHPELMLTKTNHQKNKVWCEVPSFMGGRYPGRRSSKGTLHLARRTSH